MMRHTPGPWKWENNNWLRAPSDATRIHTIINDEGCTVYRDTNVEEFTAEIEANKRLIAAAPDLLTALIAATENVPDWTLQAQAAIKKAVSE